MRKFSTFTKKELNLFFSCAHILLKRPELTILATKRMLDYGRLLVVTPRAVGTAPQRNKIRRRLKAIFYENKLFERPFDYAIIIRKEATQLPFDSLEEIIVRTFNQ